MNHILAIFRKDTRRLWPQIAVLLALITADALTDPTYTSLRVPFLSSILLPIAAWILIVSLIHQESIPGDRQYWLTRPYWWPELIAAKALFIAAFVNLPLLVYHLAVYVAMGIPIHEHLGSLFWRQVFLTALFLLPAVALAVLTRSFTQVVAAVVAVTAAGWLAWFILTFVAPYVFRIGSLTRGANSDIAVAALLTIGVAAIVVLQYSSRRTAWARALGVGLAMAVLATGALANQFAGRRRFSGTTSLRLTLDPRPRSYRFKGWVEIPVRIEGMRPDMVLNAEHTSIWIDSAGSSMASLHDVEGDQAWLSIYDGKLVTDAGALPVHVYGELDFTTFDQPRTFPLPHGHPVAVPGVGVCRDALEPEGWISFVCYTPQPHAGIAIGTPGNSANWIIPMGFVEQSIPTSADFEPLAKFTSQLTYKNWEQLNGAQLLVAAPLPPIHITFDFPNLRLTDYAQ